VCRELALDASWPNTGGGSGRRRRRSGQADSARQKKYASADCRHDALPALTVDARVAASAKKMRDATQGPGLKPGQTVCDMGCGNGFYTLQLARRVGSEGKVLAWTSSPRAHMLAERAKSEQVDNVETILGTLVDPGCLPKASTRSCWSTFTTSSRIPSRCWQRAPLKPGGRIAWRV
jgi:hypothetical protein